MIVEFTTAAWGELREALLYYEEARPGLGREFLTDYQRTVGHIEQFPNAWQLLAPGIRRCRLKRFPYGLVYQVREDRALVFAVMHLHRRPGYWKERLPG